MALKKLMPVDLSKYVSQGSVVLGGVV